LMGVARGMPRAIGCSHALKKSNTFGDLLDKLPWWGSTRFLGTQCEAKSFFPRADALVLVKENEK
jgi:hypothetical protein